MELLLKFKCLFMLLIVLLVVSSILIDLLIFKVLIYFLKFMFISKWNCDDKFDFEINNLLVIFFNVNC